MDLLQTPIESVRAIDSKLYEKLRNKRIEYFLNESLFGSYFAAFDQEELCFLKFYDSNEEAALEQLKMQFKNAVVARRPNPQPPQQLKLLLIGTDFEVSVWTALLNIHAGNTLSYNDIATAIEHPKSVRAVGNAVGKNPISYIVPCHRVIRKNGELGGFGSGPQRKLNMLHFEGAKI